MDESYSSFFRSFIFEQSQGSGHVVDALAAETVGDAYGDGIGDGHTAQARLSTQFK